MPYPSTTVLSAGVDTLTCSAPWGGGIHSMISLAQYLQREDAAHGSKTSPFKRGSYRGAQTAHVGLAFKPERVLVELRGEVAHEFWPHFTEQAEKVSRIDVEVSVRQEPYDHEMALRLWHMGREEAQQRGRPSDFRLNAEADGGTTLYIGQGASRYQGRLYERFFKTHQEEDRQVWRYEVQSRRERAQQMAGVLVGMADIQPIIQAAVHRHFACRGIQPIYDPSADFKMAPLARPTTDQAKSLNWLATSVAPALRRHVAWGSYPHALRALGIEATGEQQQPSD